MKTSKVLQVITGWTSAAIAAAALIVAAPAAQAAEGDIYSIETVSGDASSGKTFPNPADPLTVGEKATFMLRLLNRIDGDHAPGSTNSWRLVLKAPVSEQIAEFTDMRPRISVIVSGMRRDAIIESISPTDGIYGANFTDMICSYTVKSGDIALPLALADKSGNEISLGAASAEYDIFDPYGLWAIVDGSGTELNASTCTALPPVEKPARKTNWSLTAPEDCIYVQTIDFAPYPDGETENWRSVYEGMTSCKGSGLPGVVVTGSGSEDTITMYLWSDAEDNLSLPDATEEYNGVHVQTLKIGPGETEKTFRILGKTLGGTANIYLSATPTNRYDLGGELINNFLVRKVVCVEAPEPFITLSFADGSVRATTTPETDPEVRRQVPVTVTLSKEFDQAFDLDLTTALVDNPGVDVFAEKYVALSCDDPQTENSWEDADTKIRIPANTKSAQFFLYALGGDKLVYNKGIRVTPSIDAAAYPAAAAFFAGGAEYCTLKIQDVKPIVVKPTGASASDPERLVTAADANGPFKVGMIVRDAYRDLLRSASATSAFSVIATFKGEGLLTATTTTTGVEFPTDGTEAEVTLKAPGRAGEYDNCSFVVRDQNGNESAPVYFSITVVAPRTVGIGLYNTTADAQTGSAIESRTFVEGQKPFIRYTFSQSYENDVYVFLVPLNEASSNLVASQAFTMGLKVAAGSTNSVVQSTHTLEFLDGCDAAQDLRFDVMIRDKEALDDPTSVELPEVAQLDPSQNPFTLAAVNVQPTITTVMVNGDTVENGAVYGEEINSDVEQEFSALIHEPGIFDHTLEDEDKQIVTRWVFTEGLSGKKQNPVYVTNTVHAASPDIRIVCPHEFVTAGCTQEVSVAVMDKDDLAAATPWETLPQYTFKVVIGEAPQVVITTSKGFETGYYDENENGGHLNVTLSPAPEQDVDVQLTIDDGGVGGGLELETYELHFKAGSTTPTKRPTRVNFVKNSLNGLQNPGVDPFSIIGKVVTEGQGYLDGYAEVYINNVTPTINNISRFRTDATNQVTLGTLYEFNVTAADIPIDLDSENFEISFDYGGNVSSVKGADLVKTLKNGVTAAVIGTLSFTPNVEGYSYGTLIVDDGDGANNSKLETKIWFYVEPTKHITVTPFGPATSTNSKYDQAAGLGIGRVFANGNTCSAQRFISTWYFAVTQPSAMIYAWGYPSADAPYADNGWLADEFGETLFDTALLANGRNGEKAASADVTAGYYMIDGEWDNYFYRWIDNSLTPVLNEKQLLPHPGLSHTLNPVALDPYEPGKTAYEEKNIEAIFSREYLKSDNCGDINADGIPDVYAVKYGIYGTGAADGDDAAGDDLAHAANNNDDGDFLPSAQAPVSGIVPGIETTWLDQGLPFTARLEIRGFGDGLNDAPAVTNCAVGVKGVTPDRDFSELETIAWGNLSDEERATWSPERPTNPTTDDTDGDGFTDGYEYYFWYNAKVGYLDDDGVHHYLEGRRYNPRKPLEGDRIAPAEIVTLFDPLVSAIDSSAQIRDTDNDGLVDVLEFLLGTNPVDFDTDNDGLPDGYEVMIGTDPLRGTGGNPDGDWMAYHVFNNWYDGDTWRVVELLDESGEVPGSRFVAIPVESEISLAFEVANGYAFTVGGRSYFTYEEPKFDSDTGKIVVEDIYGYALDSDGNVSASTLIRRGTITEDGASVSSANVTTVSEDAFTSSEGGVFDHAYSLWRYSDGDLVIGSETYLPAGAVVLNDDVHDALGLRIPVIAIHHHVYQFLGYDPRTAWGDEWVDVDREFNYNYVHTTLIKWGAVNTRQYNTLDEFLVMTFFLNSGSIGDGDVTPDRNKTINQIWNTYCTNPLDGSAAAAAEGEGAEGEATVAANGTHGADTDADGVPDGWELYVMSGPAYEYYFTNGLGQVAIHTYLATPPPTYTYGFNYLISPLMNNAEVSHSDGNGGLFTETTATYNGLTYFPDRLSEKQEYDGFCSTAFYTNFCATISYPDGWNWTNKAMPTDPWNPDTDGDGIIDSEEQRFFSYGNPAVGGPGGGLDPLSWDTDGDGLPDIWEVQYRGTPSDITTIVSADATAEGEFTVPVGEEAEAAEAAGAPASEVQGEERTIQRIVNGMDGSAPDARCQYVAGHFYDYDWDHDGLENWQEYMTGTMRIWRYDDPITPFELQTIPQSAEEWGRALVDRANPNLVENALDHGAYFSLQDKVWDFYGYGRRYFFFDGVNHDLAKDDFDAMNRWTRYILDNGNPAGLELYHSGTFESDGRYGIMANAAHPVEYFGTSPTKADSDGDGMDDYYELFHGLNPILGSSDLIYAAYRDGGRGVNWNGQWNHWMAGMLDIATYNFMDFPWMNGLPWADPDGDNIRNDEEAIAPNMRAAMTWHHTDPTPLWMTDSSYEKSLVTLSYYPAVRNYAISVAEDGFEYNGEYYNFADFPGFVKNAEGSGGYFVSYAAPNFGADFSSLYSFEENEGFDSDHDGVNDYAELQASRVAASDPQSHDDPFRHQAMYFNGEDAFCATPIEIGEAAGDTIRAELEQLLLEFTVEAWVKAENPEKGAQTIVERTVVNTFSNPGDQKWLRKNFFIGIDEEGRFYGKYDSKGTDSTMPVKVVGPLATAEWTHLAATYDGERLQLYVNGVPYNATPSTVQPQNIVIYAAANMTNGLHQTTGYTLTAANFIGASPLTAGAVLIDNPASTIDAYGDFFQGYVDEVRIWDGARTANEINAAWKTRMTSKLADENRYDLYEAFLSTGTYAWNARALYATRLPAELVYHYAFDQLFGAAEADQVSTSPAGFTYEGVDGKAVLSRPDGYVNTWWSDMVPAHSTVYNDYAWVPWINNTVSHLPRFDGTTTDSRYWSEDFAGVNGATGQGFSYYGFPHTHEIYSAWVQGGDALNTRYIQMRKNEGLFALYGFTLRTAVCRGSDLLPMGGAFAKYIDAMWDDGLASTVWNQTGIDSDNDGLPDWWEAEWGDVDWDTIIDVDGVEMTAGDAYLRALARGAHEGAADGDSAFAQKSDSNANGLPDWWEQMYKLSNSQADRDSDNDGLSNVAEYNIYDGGFLYEMLNPTLPRTDGSRLDYFRTIGKLYFGELFSDHDMMEDDWEDATGDLGFANRYIWDALADSDHDGWSNFAECRYTHDMRELNAKGVSHMLGDTESLDMPVPTVKVNLRYGSSQKLLVSAKEGSDGTGEETALYAPVIFHFYTENAADAPYGSLVKEDATFTVTPGQTIERTLMLGPWSERVVRGCLAPGHLDPTALNVESAALNLEQKYKWVSNGAMHFGSYNDWRHAKVRDPYAVLISDNLADNVTWMEALEDWMSSRYEHTTGKAYFELDGVRIGTVDCNTGDFEFNMGAFKNLVGIDVSSTNELEASSFESCLYRLKYTYTLPGTGFANGAPLELSLSRAETGYVKEGRNTVTAFVDLDNDGAYTPGEPFGIATGVDVGWYGAECTIELTDSHAVFARVSVADAGEANTDRNTLYGTSSGDYTNVVAGATSGGTFERVRVIRTTVNDQSVQTYGLPQCIVLDKWLDVNNRRSFIHEGDFLRAGEYDIDWSNLQSEVIDRLGGIDVEKVGYRIVLGNGTIEMTETNNLLGVVVERRFDRNELRQQPVCVEPVNNSIIYGAKATFKWSMGAVNNYTAFQLTVSRVGGGTVYDSGIRLAPPRDSNGNYTWVAPLFAGDQTANGSVFEAGAKYTWRVTMYNAKFQTALWSAASTFGLETSDESDINDHGYGTLEVAVKYYGPGDVIAAGGNSAVTRGAIRVEAFENPDFSGMPAARTFVGAEAFESVTNDAKTANAKLVGLKSGKYYVRAWVDTDGDFERDAWESWGYACYRDRADGMNSMFSPEPATVDTLTKSEMVTLYIEDSDTDGDWLPDAWEMVTQGSLAAKGPMVGTDGYVEINPKLDDNVVHSPIPMQTFSTPTMAALLLGIDTAGSPSDLAKVNAILSSAGVADPSDVTIDSFDREAATLGFEANVSVKRESGSKAINTYASQPAGEVTATCKLLYSPTLVNPVWTVVKTWQEPVTGGKLDVEVDFSGITGLDPDSGFFKVEIEK